MKTAPRALLNFRVQGSSFNVCACACMCEGVCVYVYICVCVCRNVENPGWMVVKLAGMSRALWLILPFVWGKCQAAIENSVTAYTEQTTRGTLHL